MNTEGKTGATPYFPAGKQVVVPAFSAHRLGVNNRELSPLFSFPDLWYSRNVNTEDA